MNSFNISNETNRLNVGSSCGCAYGTLSNCAMPPWEPPIPVPLPNLSYAPYQPAQSFDWNVLLNSASGLAKAVEENVASGLEEAVEEKKNNEDNKGEIKMFSNMFSAVKNGDFRLDTNGRIAVHTSKGYKVYNVNKKRLVNCDNFVFDVGDEWFFTVPTTKVKVGDIILINNTPKCVMKVNDDTITVINYENSVVEEILPERHIFMGNAYFYIKVVSMFGSNNPKKKSSKKMLKWMLMSKLFKPSESNPGFSNPMNPMTMMFMAEMFKDSEEEFDNLFDFDLKLNDDESEDTEDE